MTEQTTQSRDAFPATPGRRHRTAARAALLAVLLALSGGNVACTDARGASDWSRNGAPSVAHALASGTRIRVALGCNVSSGTARVGDPWRGTVTECVWTGNDGVIPPGSEVSGVITAVSPAHPGGPAMLELGIRSIRVNGEQELIVASSAAVVAGSARARIMCPTAARFAIGSPGWQVVLSDLSMMTFEVDQAVALR